MHDWGMHDWILHSLSLDWEKGTLEIHLTAFDGAGAQSIRAYEVKRLDIPRHHEWGPSRSILETNGPEPEGNAQKLILFMQSGDEIVIVAERFDMPV